MSIQLPYSALGLAVGLLVGMTGVGGGSLMTPLLILLFGIHPMAAVGTDLLFAAATKSVGTLVNGINHMIDWRVSGLLAAGSLPATAATLFVLSNLPPNSDFASALIRWMLVGALLLTAAALLLLPAERAMARGAAEADHRPRRRTALLTVGVGVVLGVLVSLTSIGAGALGIIALLLLYPRMRIARLIGSDIAHAVPLTLLAGIGHLIMGSVNLSLLASLLAGSIPGIIIGSYLSPRAPERVVRTVLALTLLAVGAKMVF